VEKDVYSADSISRKIWMTPKLEVLDIEQTYADDNYWEFKEFNGFWKRNFVSTSVES
jgi:hypothetical protein